MDDNFLLLLDLLYNFQLLTVTNYLKIKIFLVISTDLLFCKF